MSSGLNGALEVYGRTAEQLAHVKVQVTLAHENGGPDRTVEAQVGNVEDVAGGTLRRATFSVPLTGLEPGAYVARAVVRDGAEEVGSTTRQLDVLAGAAPVVAGPPVDPLNVAHGQLFNRAKGEWVTAAPAVAAHANRGFDLFAKGDFATAAPELQQAFDANQKTAATGFVLGWAWEGAGSQQKAISAWRAAAAADPSLVPVHLAIADAYLRLAQPALAVQALRAGLAATPDSVELKVKLGQIVGSR
jgi:tetratricopeptide (TPR) repeat protein